MHSWIFPDFPDVDLPFFVYVQISNPGSIHIQISSETVGNKQTPLLCLVSCLPFLLNTTFWDWIFSQLNRQILSHSVVHLIRVLERREQHQSSPTSSPHCHPKLNYPCILRSFSRLLIVEHFSRRLVSLLSDGWPFTTQLTVLRDQTMVRFLGPSS